MNVSVLEKNKCFGCGSCFQACPKSAISMEEDDEGFLFPEIDDEKCVGCSLCVKKCPSLSPLEKNHFKQETFAALYKNDDICRKSASGGAFAAFAMETLSRQGAIFGCAYDDDLNAVQTEVRSSQDLIKLQGSKYVSSDTKNTFIEAKNELLNGKSVLYSGRPCQIAGLRKYLEKEYENLVTVDLVCHGVPSQKLFTKYLEWLGRKNGGKIIYYGFRDKDVGGWSCGGKFKTKTKTKTNEASCDPYYASFLRGETYRYSCYECPFASAERAGDISVCDFWGVEKFYPDIDTAKGVSGIIINTEKGKRFLGECKNEFALKEIKLDELKAQNTNLNHPTPMPEKRMTVYQDCIVDGKFVPDVEFASPLKYQIRQIVSKILPKSVKNIIKMMVGKR